MISPERLTEIRECLADAAAHSQPWASQYVLEMAYDLLAIIDAMAARPAPMEEGHAYVMQLKRERDEALTQLGDALERLALREKADT